MRRRDPNAAAVVEKVLTEGRSCCAVVLMVRSELGAAAGRRRAVVVGERVRVERARVSDGALGGERDWRGCGRVWRRVVKVL